MTLRLYAERKGWELGEVTIELSHERAPAAEGETGVAGYVDVITSHIEVNGPLTPEQSDRLREIAGRCRVHRTLLATPRIVEELVVTS